MCHEVAAATIAASRYNSVGESGEVVEELAGSISMPAGQLSACAEAANGVDTKGEGMKTRWSRQHWGR